MLKVNVSHPRRVSFSVVLHLRVYFQITFTSTLKTINLDLESKTNDKNKSNEPTTGKQDQQCQQQPNR